MGIEVDGANQKLILDSDGDTYLEAATDDTIKVYISGAHDATISANAINILSGTTLTIDSGATITNSGTANGFSSADPASADGDSLGTASLEWSDLFLADGGTIKFGNDQDVILTHVADTALLLNAAMRIQFRDSGLYIGSNADGDLDIVSDGTAVDSINLESAGGITLDAGVAATGVTYEDDGTAMLSITNSSSDVVFTSKVQDKDILFKGDDGGSAITALTIDMSDGGILQTRAGVGFPSTQVANSGANVLDDYEEGTWTPVYTSDGATITNGSTNGGAYTKIGRVVIFSGSVGTGGSMSGGTAGNAVLLSLPFTAADDGTGNDTRARFSIGPSVSAYTWGGDTPSEAQVVKDSATAYIYFRDASDGYVANLRFDDLTDSASNPRNLAYFSGSMYIAT